MEDHGAAGVIDRPQGEVAPGRGGRPGPRSRTLDRGLIRLILRGLGDPDVTVVLWDGHEVRGRAQKAEGETPSGSRPPQARVILKDRATLLRCLLNPSLAFGDAYADGRLEIQGDLPGLLEAAFRAGGSQRGRLWSRWRGRLPWSNPLARARDNVYHHYDLGNDFYRLWLDERMVYTCAYFADPAMSLEEAQLAKLAHVCRKLRLKPGEAVVEAGCGWGALALYAAKHHGVTVRAFNLSHEQIAYAREQARREGLADRVEFVEADFREITGRYDAFMSVGMLEHVHPRNYRQLGDVIHRCLKPDGRGLIHSIGRNRPSAMDPWLERRIFPGAYIPALSEMLAVFEPHDFSVLDVENLRLHYARTLEHWLQRFEGVVGQIERRYGPAFVRTWRLYLAASMASFLAGTMQLFQIVFAPGASREVPWTRAHLYQP